MAEETIQCWSCGTQMTLEELSSNDGDCPECEVEIALAEYLAKALAESAALRAQLPSQVGEAVEVEYPTYHAQGMGCGLEDRGITDRYDAMAYGFQEAVDQMAAIIDSMGPLYTHPADQVAEGDAELIQLLRDQLTWHQARDKELSKSGRSGHDYYWRRLQHQEQISIIDAKLSQLKQEGKA